jgi:hypothetical protein
MTNEQHDDFPRTLLLDLAFESSVKQNDITTLTVVMSGANDAQPAEATFAVSSSWQAALGYRPSTPVSSLGFESATVETPNGQVYDVLEAVRESIGQIPRRFGPGDSVGEVCGGF